MRGYETILAVFGNGKNPSLNDPNNESDEVGRHNAGASKHRDPAGGDSLGSYHSD